MPRTDIWLRFDDSHPAGHGARPCLAMPAASPCGLAESSLSADVLDVRGPRPGLSGPPGTDHRSIRGRRGRRCHRRALARRLAAAWGQRAIVENHPGARQHRSARAGRTCAPRRVHAADQHQAPRLTAPPGQASCRTTPSGTSSPSLRSPASPTYSSPARSPASPPSTSSPPRPATGPARSASPPPALAPAPTSRWQSSIAASTPSAVRTPPRSHGRNHRCDRRHGGRTRHIRDAADPARRPLPSGRQARRARGQHSAPLAPAAGRAAAHTGWRRRPSISRSGTGSGRQREHRPASSARSPATSRTPSPRAELSEWLTQHDADPMHMSPAEFGAFVVSEAERAAVLLSTS